MAEHMNEGEVISVEVAYALPAVQTLVSLQLPRGTTAMEAAQRSGIASRFDDVDLENATLGVFGQIVAHGRVLRNGDRVEIYRPLTADPKAVRKARAERVTARRKRK
jgi:putative ubiquitin-RnfH superfamily antitoxin RatB of RatAB toxin-antitoxin module